ncbi:MAG: hypothetical protein JWQ27_2059 [Ferruginibacter sp.]|nr:hypothetical protein [Ferruginibacter sp.]
MLVGDQQVQGIDYAYTIQGWLKGVNSSSLDPAKDMGQDGLTTNALKRYIGRDEFGFSLNYFNGDYSSIGAGAGTTSMPLHTASSGITNGLPSAAYKPLYNGNISSMVVNINKLSLPEPTGTGTTSGAVLYNYTYDQLNRLKAMDAYKGLNGANNSWANMVPLDHYQERISYDPNGNILTYKRNGNKNSQLLMDDLAYSYNLVASGALAGKPLNNKLRRVTDAVTNTAAYDESDAATGVSDLENQTLADNYIYDAIGNLIGDSKENINLINWNVYGKISDINFNFISNANKKISYRYDASGNRIGKQVEKYGTTSGAATTSIYTWYVRDASGNVMAVYNSTGNAATVPTTLDLTERHIYGSSRLGISTQGADAKQLPQLVAGSVYNGEFIRGKKVYEMTNHLGNVLVTLSDKKNGVDDGTYDETTGVKTNSTPDGIIDYYVGDVITANDYYPFGMGMVGRKYAAPASKYRYGFNGKESDNEVKGEGNHIDYGERLYDPRLGRWISVDPLSEKYPFYSPYSSSNNNPIYYIDNDGRDAIARIVEDKNGKKTLIITANYHYIEGEVSETVRNLVKKEFRKFGDRSDITYNGEKISVKFEINFVSHPVDEKDAKPSYYNQATADNDLIVANFTNYTLFGGLGDNSTHSAVVVNKDLFNSSETLSDGSKSMIPKNVAENEFANFIVHGIGHNIGFTHNENGEGVMDRIVGEVGIVTSEGKTSMGVPTGTLNATWSFEWDHISKQNVQDLVNKIDGMTKVKGKNYWDGKTEKNLQGDEKSNPNYNKAESLENTGTTVIQPDPGAVGIH